MGPSRGVAWVAAIVLAAFAGAHGTAQAPNGFVEQIPADSQGTWSEQRTGTRWHRGKPSVGGLGFEVVLGDWPRLLQRGFLDVFDRRNGTREVYAISGWLDLGEVRTGGEAGTPELASASWCSREYELGSGEQAMRFHVSRLTPAFLCTTRSPMVHLFAGEKWLGDVPPNYAGVTAEGIGRHGASTEVPSYMAYVARGQAVVKRTDAPVSLAELGEPWVLFWYGEAAPFRRTRVPNVLWRTPRLNAFMRTEYFVPADLPVLVVLERRPSEARPTDDALRVSFGAEGAGAIAVLPVFGLYHPPADVTQAWRDGLPSDVLARCRAWSRRARFFPVGCTEWRRVSDGGAGVTIRQRFTYLESRDEWETTGERLAPIPPVVAMARRYGFPVESSGGSAEIPIATHSGPYSGVPDTDTVEFTVGGLTRYINDSVASPPPTQEEGRILVDELRAEVRKAVAAGALAPAMSILIYRPEFHFANPGELLLALAEAAPYLDEAGRRAALAHALAEAERLDPLTVQSVPSFEGSRREYFHPIAPEYQATISRQTLTSASCSIRGEERANNAYALWALAQAGGYWEALERRWADIKSAATAGERWSDWATCGYLWQHNEDRGSTRAVNGQFARWVAMARMARRFGDSRAEELAMSRLAKTALLRFAQGKTTRYMYDEKFQIIDADPDWMLELSTATGETGPGLLWTDRWAGAEDDIRQVIRWDEFGPAVAQMFGDHWHPVLPAFQDLTPECGRFLADHLLEESQRYVAALERNAPHWYVTRRESTVGKENCMDSPRNSYSIFLAKCYVLGTDGEEMLRHQDIPFTRVGDLYHLRRLTANLRCLGGLRWEPAKEAAP